MNSIVPFPGWSQRRRPASRGCLVARPLRSGAWLVPLVVARLLVSADASAAGFRYVDRSGRAHLVDVPAAFFSSSQASRGLDLGDSSEPLPPAPPTPAPEPDKGRGRAPAPAAEPRSLDVLPPAPVPALPFPRGQITHTSLSTQESSLLLPVALQPVETDAAAIPFFKNALEAAEFYSLPVELVLAVIKVESNFNPGATSRKGARGLMQLMPATATSLGVSDPLDPAQNILAGTYTLRSLINEFEGQLALALAAYNAGAGAVRRHGGIPPITETQRYVPSVLHLYRAYLASGVGRSVRKANAEGDRGAGASPSEGRSW